VFVRGLTSEACCTNVNRLFPFLNAHSNTGTTVLGTWDETGLAWKARILDRMGSVIIRELSV
jgi:hypothetical protein